MGLGGARTSLLLPAPADDLEWLDLSLLASRPARTRRPASSAPPAPTAGTLGPAMVAWLRRHPLWVRGSGPRILLVDLDNLRAGAVRWQARMEVVVWLSRIADHSVLAGQHGAVARARPHLAELADAAHAVDDGSDLADYVLLEAAEAISAAATRTVVMSNDGIFVRLAGRGPLTVLSPSLDALSDRLRDAASRVVDLTAVEQAALVATGEVGTAEAS